MREMGKRIAAVVCIIVLTFSTVACNNSGKSERANVVSVIDGLPSVSELAVGDASKVEDARTLYDALSDGEKAKVKNYDKLTAAEEVMATLMQIAALEPSFTSGGTAIVGVPYVPQITGYAFGETETSVTYTVPTPNAAGAILDNGTIIAANAGSFTVEAVVSYAGYNIKRNAERVVTVSDPAPPIVTLQGQLSYDAALTDSADFTGATVKIGTFDATVSPDGSWTADVPYGTYNVVAAHPLFAAKPIENFTVGADTGAPTIEFGMYAAKGNGQNTEVYDWDKKAYNHLGGTASSGNPRIDFPGMKVEANEEFVFRAEILYSENTGRDYKYGLTIHDGKAVQEREFSLGLLLANDGTGRFMGYNKLDQSGGNVSHSDQGARFGGAPVLPTVFGEKTITLTYVRKEVANVLQWFMIVEWDSTGDGSIDKRFVRQPSTEENVAGSNGPFAPVLQAIDGKTLYLGLTFGVNTSVGITKCGNLYFAKGKTAVDAVDTEDGLNVPDGAIAAIESLPATNALTINDASAVESARALYNALNSTGKAKVTNYDKLTAAETVMTTLKAIDALTPTFTSAETATVNEAYTPQITGYEQTGVTASVQYAIGTTEENTANATLMNDTITATQAGKFTVEAEITYTGYNIKHRIGRTVTVVNPEAPKCSLSGQLSFDSKLTTNSVDYTNATVKVGAFDATVQSNGSWTVQVPYDTYTVTATHPWFVTKTVENFEVGASTTAPAIKFDMWKAVGNGAYANEDLCDTNHKVYTVHGGATRTGNSRVHFPALTVSGGEEFVVSVDILSSTNTKGTWRFGLLIYDGTQFTDLVGFNAAEFSLGLLLSNDLSGRVLGYSKLDQSSGDNSFYAQGKIFSPDGKTQTDTTNAPVLPKNSADGKITLTYLRKKVDGVLTWYMVFEFDGKRFVRQPDTDKGAAPNAATNMRAVLQGLDNTKIHLGLGFGVAETDGITEIGNLYFATGTGVADTIDLTNTTT